MIRQVWNEAAAAARPSAKQEARKLAQARAVFKQAMGRDAVDNAELDMFAAIQARGAKPTAAALRRERMTVEARLIKAMVAGGNHARSR